MLFEHSFEVTFGDCDPAEIVFYPNFFAWFDATYHLMLKSAGIDHGTLRTELGARGTGLMAAGADFLAPVAYGDRLTLGIETIEWSARSFRLQFAGALETRAVLRGHEVRGVFVDDGERLRAAPVAPLRALLASRGLAPGE